MSLFTGSQSTYTVPDVKHIGSSQTFICIIEGGSVVTSCVIQGQSGSSHLLCEVSRSLHGSAWSSRSIRCVRFWLGQCQSDGVCHVPSGWVTPVCRFCLPWSGRLHCRCNSVRACLIYLYWSMFVVIRFHIQGALDTVCISGTGVTMLYS